MLGLNTLGTPILCVCISPELLQTMLPLVNIVLDFSLKNNHSLVLAETIQLNQETTSYMGVDGIGNIGVLKGTH